MIYYFSIFFSLIFVYIVIKLVKKDKLDEKYSILWLVTGIITLVVSVFPGLISYVAEKFNVYYPPSLMFLFAILIAIVYIIHITLVITKQNKMIIKLTQELGILKQKTEENFKEKKND